MDGEDVRLKVDGNGRGIKLKKYRTEEVSNRKGKVAGKTLIISEQLFMRRHSPIHTFPSVSAFKMPGMTNKVCLQLSTGFT